MIVHWVLVAVSTERNAALAKDMVQLKENKRNKSESLPRSKSTT